MNGGDGKQGINKHTANLTERASNCILCVCMCVFLHQPSFSSVHVVGVLKMFVNYTERRQQQQEKNNIRIRSENVVLKELNQIVRVFLKTI